MIEFVPMPLIDDFLVDYTIGHALVVAFVLAVLGALPLKSGKVLSLNFILFGLIFTLAPLSASPAHYRFFGLALLVVGPVLFTTTRS